MAYHAKLSPSSAHRWTDCSASINAQRGLADTSSVASMTGTCGHQMAAEHLEHSTPLDSYIGREMWFLGREEHWCEDWPHTDVAPEHVVTVTQELIDAVDTATAYVKQRVAETGGLLEVEQRVPIGHFTGEEGAGGTSDVVLMYGDTIETMDFKLGRHKVHAYEDMPGGKRRMNLQLACYTLGALEKFGGLFDFKHARATILQPFVNHISDYSCDIAELLEVQEFLRVKAEETRSNPVFKPNSENCHFCKRNGNCPAQTEAVISVALDGFQDVDTARPAPAPTSGNALGSLYAAIPMVQGWCKAIAERAYSELKAGRPVVRNDGLAYKLVDGQRGDRKWGDADAVEKLLKETMRLKDDVIYTKKLISPAGAEDLSKKKRKAGSPPPLIGPTQWTRLKEHITQADGAPSIALETDPRPAVGHAAAGFGDVSAADDCSDLGL